MLSFILKIGGTVRISVKIEIICNLGSGLQKMNVGLSPRCTLGVFNDHALRIGNVDPDGKLPHGVAVGEFELRKILPLFIKYVDIRQRKSKVKIYEFVR
jgi:hypothetical protein